MPVYVIADVKVTDDSWLPAYATEVHDIVHKHGGKYLPVAAFAGCQFHGNNSSRR
jgi:uncharacterized protein (DUF1330 family)